MEIVEQSQARGKDAGIANIVAADGTHRGMGIVVGPRHVLTCAHVVNAALGRALGCQDQPVMDAAVSVTFPFATQLTRIRSRVIAWRPVGSNRGDMAVLQLDETAPVEVGLAILAQVDHAEVGSEALSVFGIGAGTVQGLHVDAKVMGTATPMWIQIDSVNTAGAFVRGGFSGAAVWNESHAVSVGMIVARYVSDVERIAFMIPTLELKAFWSDLPVEIRNLSSQFEARWTLVTLTTFTLLLVHWAVDRGVNALRMLSLGGEHKALAAFWGMHLGAALLPIVTLLLLRHAKAFSCHPWHARVPRFGLSLGVANGSSRPAAAALSLILLLLLPLAAQVHFLWRFHNNGHVYISPGSFGLAIDDVESTGGTCFPGAVVFCTTKPEFGRYSLMSPRLATKAGYWDDAYRYGEPGKPDGGTVTFFPLLQPLLILTLTALAGLLGISALWLVLRRPGALPVSGLDAVHPSQRTA